MKITQSNSLFFIVRSGSFLLVLVCVELVMIKEVQGKKAHSTPVVDPVL